jgi:hypothetical protein
MAVVTSAGKISASAAVVRRRVCRIEITPKNEFQALWSDNARATIWLLPSRSLKSVGLIMNAHSPVNEDRVYHE